MLNNKIVHILFVLALLTALLCDAFGEVPLWIYILLVLIYSLVHAYGSTVLSAQFFIPVKFKGESSSKNIALTFDDGPIVGKTERILEILRNHQVPAAFFCIGNRVSANMNLVKRIFAEGHLIGNHSYWHGKTFDLQSASKIAEELRNTDEAIQTCIGVTPKFFRPPYGVTNPMVASAIQSGNYTTIGWSLRSFDTMTADSSKLFNRITSTLKGGDVILLHDYCESTIEMLPELLEHIQRIGLKIVRVDELLNEKAYV